MSVRAPPGRWQWRGGASRRTSWPDGGDLDLLRAALLHDRRALDSWARARTDTAAIERAARLLPLVARNLESLETGAAGSVTVAGRDVCSYAAASLRDAMRVTWAENLRVLEAVAPVLQRLDDAGAPMVLLKGIALATNTYPSPALRPIGDVDVLVGPRALATARATLEASGFGEVSPMPAGAVPHLHSFGYRRSDGLEIDLHGYGLMECCWPGADDALLARARRAEVGGVTRWVPAHEDHLLLVCVHGLRWSSRPAIHWVADAVMILERSGAELAWPVVVEAARERGVTVPLRRALDFLRRELDAPIPDDALRTLAEPRPPLRERVEAAARMRPPSLWRGLLVHWCTLARAERSTPFWRRLALFPAYLRDVWGLTALWSVPVAAARRSAARLAARKG